MTFGEKLKQARTQAGLTQEQLAETISVSRSAVAKWESDKGLPDIENLRAIAQLLHVSVDYLLDEAEAISFEVTREPLSLEGLEVTGQCRSQKDAAVLAKYPRAAITALLREKRLSKLEHLLEWTAMPGFGLFTAADQLQNTAACYLVEEGERQYLVSVSDEFLTTRRLAQRITGKKFAIGDDVFKRFYRIQENRT